MNLDQRWCTLPPSYSYDTSRILYQIFDAFNTLIIAFDGQLFFYSIIDLFIYLFIYVINSLI